MEKYYSINDIAEMTGLSDRTLRNYIKSGTLSGEKIDGVWQFTAEEYGDFITDKSVIPSLKAKKNALVYDFLLNEKKKAPEMCSILDFPADLTEAMKISDFFCSMANASAGKVRMNFSYQGGNARVMLEGDAVTAAKIIGKYFGK